MKVQNLVAGATAVLATTSLQAFAAVPVSVTSGITDAVADVGTIGALILGVVIAIAGFMWIRKPIH